MWRSCEAPAITAGLCIRRSRFNPRVPWTEYNRGMPVAMQFVTLGRWSERDTI